MSALGQFANIENLNVWGAIQKLVEVCREARSNQDQIIPMVSLFLRSGQSLQGQILALTPGPDKRALVIATGAGEKKQGHDLSYVFLDDIAGLTVHEAAGIADFLSGGKIARPQGPPPSALDIQKEIKKFFAEINLIVGTNMSLELGEVPDPVTDEILHGLMATVRDLNAVLRKMAGNEISRQALFERNLKFVLTVGEEPKLTVHKSRCQILIGVHKNRVDRLSRESLKSNLEDLL